MLTRHELRVLYLLRKQGGRAKHSEISQAMSRAGAHNRSQALSNLEQLELISSAKTPTPRGHGGTGGLVYWLTCAGSRHVQDLIETFVMQDPAKESRGRPKASMPCE